MSVPPGVPLRIVRRSDCTPSITGVPTLSSGKTTTTGTSASLSEHAARPSAASSTAAANPFDLVPVTREGRRQCPGCFILHRPVCLTSHRSPLELRGSPHLLWVGSSVVEHAPFKRVAAGSTPARLTSHHRRTTGVQSDDASLLPRD